MPESEAFERAWALLRSRKVEEAKAAFLADQKKTGALAEIEQTLQQAREAQAAGKLVDASKKLDRVIELDPVNAEAHDRLARIAAAAGERDAARTHVDAVMMLAPKARESWGLRIDLAYNERQYAEAKRLVDEALTVCGEHPYLFEKGLASALMLKDTHAGISYVERELRMVPDHAQGWLNLARLKSLAGDLDGSIAAARTLLERQPQNAEAHFHLGNVFEAQKKSSDAEAEYRTAMKLQPDDWRYASNLGALLVSDGTKAQYDEAKKLLTALLPRVPADEWRPAYNLALAHVRLGEKAQAREIAGRILRSAKPVDPISEEARRLIANLDG